MYRLAQLLGITPNAVNAYFKAGVDPRLSTVLKWCRALDVSIEELFDSTLDETEKTMPKPKSSDKNYYGNQHERIRKPKKLKKA